MSPPRVIRTLAWFVVAFLATIGITALIVPDTFVSILSTTITSTGLYAIGAARIGVGVVLFQVSSITRAPTIIRVLGVLIVLGGVATLLIGPQRAKSIFDWLTGYGPMTIRLVGVVGVLIACALGYTLSSDRATI